MCLFWVCTWDFIDFLKFGCGLLMEGAGGASALTPAEIQEARAQADEEFKNENKSQSKKRRTDVPLKGKHKSLTEENSTLFSHGLTGKLPKSVDILRYKVPYPHC